MKNSLLTSKIKCVLFNLEELLHPGGVKAALQRLDLPHGVVSVQPSASITLALKTVGLLRFFGEDKIFSGDSILLNSVHEMGFEPAECAVVAQSDGDIEAAIKEGFWVFGMDDGTKEAEFEKKGVLVFNKFEELTELIALFNDEVDLEIKQM